MFNNTKYTQWYFNIINVARNRILENVYYEKHHVIPKGCGGDPSGELVRLTAREHFICHWLLTKMTTGKLKRSMCYALSKMCRSNQYQLEGRSYPSRYYDIARKNLSKAKKGTKHTDETKSKLSAIAKKRFETEPGTFNGKTHTLEWRKKTSEARSGDKHQFFGKKRPEHGEKVSAALKGKAKSDEHKCNIKLSWQASRLRVVCCHCNIETTKAMHTRWHGDNCKLIGISK